MKINWVQWGARNNFIGPRSLESNYKIHTFYSYYKKIYDEKNTLFERKHFLGNYMYSKLNKNYSFDFSYNFFLTSFAKSIERNKDHDECLYTLANGYQLHDIIGSRIRIHEQVSCGLDLAKLRNEYQNKKYDLDLIYSLEENLYSKVKNIIAPSTYVKSYIEGFNQDNNIFVLPYPCDYHSVEQDVSEEIDSIKIDDSALNLIFIGRFEETKGSNIIKKLANNFNRINFYIFGDVLEDVDHISSNIKFFGRTNKTTLFKYLNKMDLFILPSMSEGCSLAAAEAYSFSIPAIVSKESGSQYTDKTGYVLDAHDYDQWHQSLSKLYRNKDLITSLKNNFKNIKKHDIHAYKKELNRIMACCE